MKITRTFLALAAFTAISIAFAAEEPVPPAKPAAEKAVTDKEGWQSLFDGKTLGKWKLSDYGPKNKSEVADGELHIRIGEPMAGITWDGEPPARMNYEIELEAKRTDGHDFFCGLTFPVGKDPCTLICGGWGGSLVGLSSLDGFDASENQTSTSKNFEDKRWYKIRVRVTKSKIEAWIDDDKVVNIETAGHKIGIRWEVEPAVPLGVSTWFTGSALRNIRLRKLD